MISLNEYIIEEKLANNFIIEYNNILIEDCVINEAFQSDLLSKLAKRIYDVEEEHRKNDKSRAERFGYNWKTMSKNAKSFASIFGPVNNGSKKIQGLKWDEIKDSDFIYYKHDDEKAKKKLFADIRAIAYKNEKADCIVCEPDTQNIVYFIKGYSGGTKSSVNGPKEKLELYTFKPKQAWKRGVQKETMSKGKYNQSERDLTPNEIIDIIKDFDVYELKITDDMITDYQTLAQDRKEAQQGVIYYDKVSLDRMLREQKARYAQAVKEMKQKALSENPMKLWDKMKDINNEVVELYTKIISDPEQIRNYSSLGDLMQYVSNAFTQFIRFAEIEGNSNVYIKNKIEQGRDNPTRRSEWDEENSRSYLSSVEKIAKDIRKKIDEIKEKM